MADLTELFADISSEAPCGIDIEYDAERVALDTAILGTPEDQFSGRKAEPPIWRDMQKQSLALLKKSKDLQIILYLIRSLIHMEGVTGFRDGLDYLEKSINEHWDLIYPLLDPDDGDPTQRLNILEELCSREFVLNSLSLCILAESKAVGRIALRDIHYATDKLPVPQGVTKPDINLIHAVFKEAQVETLQATNQAILDSLELLQKIESDVAEKVSGLGNGVNLEAIKSVIKDMRFYFEEFSGDRLSSIDDDAEVVENDGGEDTEGGAGAKKTGKASSGAVGEIASRKDVVRMLDLLCKYYTEYEPSSPVPILLQRAKFLATADFMEVVRNLMPDALGQVEFIKGPEPGAE